MLLLNKVRQYTWSSLPFRGAFLSSGVTAFACLGDAFLYPFLPVYGKELGFSAFVIGLLLSINRFVRLIANTQIANFIQRFGMKNVLILSAITAVITSLMYGLQTGLVVFLLARIVWGLCYSGLKIATLNYAALSEQQGKAFGMVHAITSLGGLFVLMIGPYLIANFGIEKSILIIAAISGLGIFLAFDLPQLTTHTPHQKVKTTQTFQPNSINLLVFILSIAIDGILVVTLAHLFQSQFIESTQLLALVAFYLLLKKLFSFAISLVGGFLTQWLNPKMLFSMAVLLSTIGLLLIAISFTIPGIVMAFFFNTLVVAFSPLMAIKIQENQSLQAISGVSTWWDFGAASGAFIGIYLVDLIGIKPLYFTLSALIILLFINFVRLNGNTNSRTV